MSVEDQSAVSALNLLREGAYVAEVLARLLDALTHGLLRLWQKKDTRTRGRGADRFNFNGFEARKSGLSAVVVVVVAVS